MFQPEVLAEGQCVAVRPQGGVISPLLANIYRPHVPARLGWLLRAGAEQDPIHRDGRLVATAFSHGGDTRVALMPKGPFHPDT